MWDELNRWWLARHKAGERPPEQSAPVQPPKLWNQPDLPPVEPIPELEKETAPTGRSNTPDTITTDESSREAERSRANYEHAAADDASGIDAAVEPPSASPVRALAPDVLNEKPDPSSRTDDRPAAIMSGAAIPDPGDLVTADEDELDNLEPSPLTGRRARPRGRRLTRPELEKQAALTPEQRLAVLDCWRRSGLPAKDFAPLVGVSRHTLYAWKQRFERLGAAGFVDQPRGSKKGSRLPDVTQQAILEIKKSQPDWGCERISNVLLRSSALPASPTAVARVLHEAGYEFHESPTRPHPDHPRRFRTRPAQSALADGPVYLRAQAAEPACLSGRFPRRPQPLSRQLWTSCQSIDRAGPGGLCAGIAAYGTPAEVLTDNGAQYVTWRGESAFHKELKRRGIEQIVAKPRHPQTLGKIERFWGTLWRECLEAAVFLDLADARADRPLHRLV